MGWKSKSGGGKGGFSGRWLLAGVEDRGGCVRGWGDHRGARRGRALIADGDEFILVDVKEVERSWEFRGMKDEGGMEMKWLGECKGTIVEG